MEEKEVKTKRLKEQRLINIYISTRHEPPRRLSYKMVAL